MVVDFWASYCGPCMHFKPTFESTAQSNKNKNLVFCAVETDKCRDAAQANNIQSIPTFHFYHSGKQYASFTGANADKFLQNVSSLNKMTMSKAGEHVSLAYKQYKPQNLLPIGYTNAGQQDKMKEFIGKLANQSASEVKVDLLLKWLETFDTNKMDKHCIDQLVELAEIAEDKQKIALIDLLRLVVLEES